MPSSAQYLERLVTQRNKIVTNLIAMGIPATQNEILDSLADKILQIKTGIDTTDATAIADDILSGKTVYGGGNKITGTMPNNGNIGTTTLHTSLTSTSIPAGYTSGGTVNISLVAASVTPTSSRRTITPTYGSVFSQVTVGAIPSNYIGFGITQKAAQTYTPSTAAQTIAAGQYLSGAQTIAGDANLVASNIKSGANIFGVMGNSKALQSASGDSQMNVGWDMGSIEVNSLTFTPNIIRVDLHSKNGTFFTYFINGCSSPGILGNFTGGTQPSANVFCIGVRTNGFAFFGRWQNSFENCSIQWQAYLV